MSGNNSSAANELDEILGDLVSDETSATFVDIFQLDLEGAERIVFCVICALLAGVGFGANVCIILANILYRTRYGRENDFYTGQRRSLSGISMVSVNPFKVNITPENRFSYFSALSGQARFRYSHVIFAVALFDILSCLIFIPLAAVNVCGGTPNAQADNWIVIVCVAWSVFQILFTTVFFFINTTIQFLSLVFPLTFKLKRSPLWAAFIVIIILCAIHAILTVLTIFQQLFQTLYEIGAGHKSAEIERNIIKLQLVLAFPLVVFIFTWVATIIMYAVVVKHIHVANLTVSRLSLHPDSSTTSVGNEQASHPSLWQMVVRKNFHKCLILGAGTLTFYALETPTFLVVYDLIPPSSWVLLAHLSVHACTPLLHIMLSRSLRSVLAVLLHSRRGRRRSTHQLRPSQAAPSR